jgi:hypothetical protein
MEGCKCEEEHEEYCPYRHVPEESWERAEL